MSRVAIARVVVGVVGAVALVLPARAEDGSPSGPAPLADVDAICPRRVDNVLAIGSSTLGSPLGPMLERELRADGLQLRRFARASSGLARPDFWNWAEKAQALIAEHDPDVVIVQLGSNDYQAAQDGARRIRRQNPEWATIYGARIDALLAVLGGDRERLVIWVGPYAFWGDNALEQGPIIDGLLRDRLSTWVARGGHARYVDAWSETMDPRRGPIMKRRLPGSRGVVEIRADDRVHLTVQAVRALLADPTIALVRACAEVTRW